MLRARVDTRSVSSTVLALLLGAVLLLQGYRYPFQINSTLTSPTYTDTPAWIQLGKWGVVAALAAALLVMQAANARALVRSLTPTVLVAVVLELAVLVGCAVLAASGVPSTDPVVLGVIAGAAIVVTLTVARLRSGGQLLTTVLVVYAVVAVAVEAVQVLLFVVADRLPALAYPGSPSVRFGSVIDDPNGFAVLLAALVPACWFGLQRRPNLRVLLVLALLACLPLTQSWTGMASVTGALVVTYLLSAGVERDLRRAGTVVGAISIVVLTGAFIARDTLAELTELKRGSAAQHAESLEYLGGGTGPTGGTPAVGVPAVDPGPGVEHGATVAPHAVPTWTTAIESSYVNILVNYGPVVLAAYLLLGILSLVVLLRGWSRLGLALRTASTSYLLCFLVASLNLGLDRTFPCNLLYFFFCGLALASGRFPASWGAAARGFVGWARPGRRVVTRP